MTTFIYDFIYYYLFLFCPNQLTMYEKVTVPQSTISDDCQWQSKEECETMGCYMGYFWWIVKLSKKNAVQNSRKKNTACAPVISRTYCHRQRQLTRFVLSSFQVCMNCAARMKTARDGETQYVKTNPNLEEESAGNHISSRRGCFLQS